MFKNYTTTAAHVLDAFGAFDDDTRGEGYRAFCPVHEKDGSHEPSLILDFTDEGRALALCQSRRCDYSEILASAGLTPDEMNNVSHIGHTLRGKREKKAATTAQRATLEARAFKASLELDKLRRSGDAAAVAIADCFGLPDGYSPSELGIGYEEHEDGGDFIVYTRTTDGHVAWLQRRDLDDPAGGWLSASNPDRGTDEEARWDAVGRLGNWRGTGPVVIAEGASDGVTAAALGTFDVLALRGAGMADRIDEVKDLLIGREIVVAADEDAAGESMTRAIASAADPYVAAVSWIDWSTGIKGYDVREFRAQSPDNFPGRFAALIGRAVRVFRTGEGFNCDPYVYRGSEGHASAIRDYTKSLGYDVAYASGAGWMFYDGTRWAMNGEPTIRQLASRLARDYGDQVQRERFALASDATRTLPAGATPAQHRKAMDDVHEQVKPKAAFVSGLQNSLALSGALRFMEGHPTVAADLNDFDRDPDVLAVANGVIELRTGKLRSMRPSDKITTRLAVPYRPEAEAPRFMAFLREVFVDANNETDEALVAYMLRLIGYAITGHSSEQALWLWHSPVGANGKSQLLHVLEYVFGGITAATSFSTFEKNNGNDNAALSDLASLRSARIVMASEGSGKPLNEDRLKSVTGEDLVKAKFMRKDLFSFRAKFAMFLATNKIPEFSDDPAVWRRIRIVPFLRHFKEHEQIKGIGDAIATEEAEGILALIAGESAKWYTDGLPLCEAVATRTTNEKQESDPLAQFLAYNVADGKTPTDGTVLLDDLWRRFQQWILAMGEDFDPPKGTPLRKSQLKAALTQRWDMPHNQRTGGAKTDAYPIRWNGHRLIAPSVVNERFNQSRAEALGMDDYVAAGNHVLDLGEDPGRDKYVGRLTGLDYSTGA